MFITSSKFHSRPFYLKDTTYKPLYASKTLTLPFASILKSTNENSNLPSSIPNNFAKTAFVKIATGVFFKRVNLLVN